MTDVNASLEFVTPTAKVLTVEGVIITITPVRTREMPLLVRAIEPLLGTLIYEAESLDVPRMLSLMGQHGEAIEEAVAICTRQDRQWVGDLLPDRTAALALASIEVNADFFSRALRVLVAQAALLAPTVAGKIMAAPWLTTKPSTA